MSPAAYLFLIIATYVCSIVMHELGHWIFLLSKFKDARIELNKFPHLSLATKVDVDVPKDLMQEALVGGIVGGLIPFIIFSQYIPGALIITMPYFLFVKNDIKQLIQLNK